MIIQDRQEILHLLKHGRSDEIRAMVEQQRRQNYPGEFVPFMDEMIREHKVSRKNVAIRSGLSQDYVYKLLRGDKHTDERDYILAMCFAIGMNLAQTQHALSSYGMPLLSEGDLRSHIIILAIQNGDNISELDEMLEKAGFPLLKTSPDMPSAKIQDTTAFVETTEDTQTESSGKAHAARGKHRVFEEIDSFTEGHHNGGNAPFDYDYQGWIRLKDEDGNIYQVEAIFASEYQSFLVFTDEQRREAERIMMLIQERQTEFYKKYKEILEPVNGALDPIEHPDIYEEYINLENGIPEADMLEFYNSLEETAVSEFFPFFLEIDKRTDKKVLEVMKKLDDTREYGTRIGSSWHGNEPPKCYIEMFNREQPELREYFQIVEYQDGTCRYTATHESCFMQLEMGQELYETVFGHKREPEYYIDTDRNEFTGYMVRYRFIFSMMRTIMHEHLLKVGGFVTVDLHTVLEEKTEMLIEQGVRSYHANDVAASLTFFREAIQVLEELGAPDHGYLTPYVCTCYKIARTLEAMKDPEEDDWWARIYGLKDHILSEENPENDTAVSCVVETDMVYFKEAGENKEAATLYLMEALDLIGHHHACQDDWQTQFEVHGSAAGHLEEMNLEESLREYRTALTIARDHHLDQNENCAHSVAVLYNNYAWVLWNRCGSEEAILYYGRALDLLESYLYSGIVERDVALEGLRHVGSALNGVYIATSRDRESIRLRERLAENNILLDL